MRLREAIYNRCVSRCEPEGVEALAMLWKVFSTKLMRTWVYIDNAVLLLLSNLPSLSGYQTESHIWKARARFLRPRTSNGLIIDF